MNDYNSTLNLPKTDFPMKADLPLKEPEILKTWEEKKLYEQLINKNKNKQNFTLHDGPPYANGDIHLGTAMNKILKDFIVKYKNMSGFCAPFVPGWDTHGLPTELKARQKMGFENSQEVSDIKLRKICEDFVFFYLESQKKQFKRMGVLGDFENPYITLQNEYEAAQVEVFAKMALKGYIYKGLRPVHWCTSCKTALAEAEIEYQEDPCYSVFVKFKVSKDFEKLENLGANLQKTYFVIWTTTTWTIPANVAIAVASDFEYAIIKANDEFYVMAKDLHEKCLETVGIKNYELIASLKGKELEMMKASHPLTNKDSLVIISPFVTLEAGTGCVHTAPGHGLEDFLVCKNYKDLETISPVDADGKLTKEAAEFAGLFVKGHENTPKDAGRAIAALLSEKSLLLGTKRIKHKYPHCWRCKDQVIFRATDQWFCSVDKFKDEVLNKIKNIKWHPSWGEERISSMVRERKDWCISRQRKWGVPIPVFFCKNCSEPLIEENSMKIVSDMFLKEGSNSWFKKDADEILFGKFSCKKCSGKSFEKEKDIMDVWFDSGTSHAAVLRKRQEMPSTADLYLEGPDQYRGWFQSSLLTCVAAFNEAPYKEILTHGWVVDGKGRKMSKSLGNGILPSEVIEEYGADILRLWVASSDYRVDVRISKDILKQLSESYRKIRNTARFILSNLYDFNPDEDIININDLKSIDKFLLLKLDLLLKECHNAYKEYEFHKIYHSVYNFCVVDMSNFYLDVIKDRLYVEKNTSKTRRAAQTTIFTILEALNCVIAPILAYTSDEIFKFIPKRSKNKNFSSVLFNEIPSSIDIEMEDKKLKYWEKIQKVSSDIRKILEEKRKNKEIGSSLEAKISLECNGGDYTFFKEAINDLKDVLIVSEVEVLENENLDITVSKASGKKCSRCWTWSETVGNNSSCENLCDRCFKVLAIK